MKKTSIIIACALAASALFVSCSKEDSFGSSNSEVILKATLNKASGPVSRAINASTGETTWKAGEKIQVTYTNNSGSTVYVKGEVSSVTGEGSAVISATLTDPKDGSTIYFKFPYSRYNGDKNINTDQVGTIEDISENFDLSEGSGKLSVSGSSAKLASSVTMTNYITIWHLTFTNSFVSFQINVPADGRTYKVTPASATDEIYVAMRGVSAKDITIFAIDDSGKLYQKVSAGKTLKETYMYNTTGVDLGTGIVLETVAAADITDAHVGYVIGTDGNAYSHVMAAEFAGAEASGVIAYVGTDPDDSYSGYNVLVLGAADLHTSNWQFNGASYSGTCSSSVTESPATAITFKNGYADTQILGSDEHQDHRHNAAQMVKYLNGSAPADSYYSSYKVDAISRPASSSPWFIPGEGQWNLMVKALVKAAGGTPADLTASAVAGFKPSAFASVFSNCGATAMTDNKYMSSTEYDNTYFWTFNGEQGRVGYNSKGTYYTYRMRACFVYKNK